MGRMDIEYVEIPERVLREVGEPDPGTRLYRQIGRRTEHNRWWDAVGEICDGTGVVSPGGASMFAPVTRAAVYKRLKEGRLTAFVFHWAPKGKRWTIREMLNEAGEFVFIPVIELRRWCELLGGREADIVDAEFDDKFLTLKREKLREYIRNRDSR